MRNKWFSMLLILALAVTGLAGCFAGQPAMEATEEPVEQTDSQNAENELFIFTAWPAFYINSEIFERQIGRHVKKNFPDITIKHVAWDNPGRRYEDLIAAGTIPDIIFDDVRRNSYRQVARFQLQYDMTELIKKYDFDTSAIDPAFMQRSIAASEGQIWSLPFNNNEWVLIYNKDIFDKFGVEYPTPGMTWDEAYDKAKQLTRQEGEVTYKGFQMNPAHYMKYNQLAEPALDPNEDKASMTSEAWVRIVDNIRRFYEIPANQLVETSQFTKGNVAMIIDTLERVTSIVNDNKDLNFDISSVPVFPEAPNAKFQPQTNGMFITNHSTKKDLAFQVIAYLSSKEFQLELAKEGVIPVLDDPDVEQAFGQNVAQWRDKNVQSVFALENAMPPLRKPGLTFIDTNSDMVWNLISEESKDSQTALRMTNESMDKTILEAKEYLKRGEQNPFE